jgi:hypothetical protein
MPTSKNFTACDRVIIGLNPLLVFALQEHHLKVFGKEWPFPKLAVYAMEDLHWSLFGPKKDESSVPGWDKTQTFFPPPNKSRRAEDGYFVVDVPDIIQSEYQDLLRAHNNNSRAMLHRAILGVYRAVRETNQDNPAFLAKYPEM